MVIQHQFPADYPAFPVEGDAVYPADPEELAVLLNVALILLCYAVYVWERLLRAELAVQRALVQPDQKLHRTVACVLKR